MNIRISEEYFPQGTQSSNRLEIKSQQGSLTPSQSMKGSILKQNFMGSTLTQSGSQQQIRNQPSPSPQINQQKVITGRKLDNQATSININSTNLRVLPIQRFPIMIESSRKRNSSDTESSIFTNRNLALPIDQNLLDFQSGDNLSMLKCESARASSKNLVKSGYNFFSSIKKIPEKSEEYQIHSQTTGRTSQQLFDQQSQEDSSNKFDSTQVVVSTAINGDEYQNIMKSNGITSPTNKISLPTSSEISKKKVKKRIEGKKTILASTLNPPSINNSKQMSTNDQSNKENMADLLSSYQEQPPFSQTQQLQQPQQQYSDEQLQVQVQNNPTASQKSFKKTHRKSASQTFSPSSYISRDQLITGKDTKKKKKNQLFLYSNLNSPTSHYKSVKRQLQLEGSSGQMSGLNQIEGVNAGSEIINGEAFSFQNNHQTPTQFQNIKNQSTNCLITNIYEKQQLPQEQKLKALNYLQASGNQQNLNNELGLESRTSQPSSSATDSHIQVNVVKKKSKKLVINGNGNGINGPTIKSPKNGVVKQTSLKKKRVQNSVISSGSSGSNQLISIALKKPQTAAYANATMNGEKGVNEANGGSPLKKTHRQTASLYNFSSLQKSPQMSEPQTQLLQSQNVELKRQKSEDFLQFINENANKIQREMEEKKRKDEQEKQKKLIERAQLKEKNETIRKKNLMRYSTRSGHSKSKHVSESNGFPLQQQSSSKSLPWGLDQQKFSKIFFKDYQMKENQKEYYNSQYVSVDNGGDINSPGKAKKIDPKQRRITLGLECLNQLNESAIQHLINDQKQRATQSVHESKRAVSPEEKKQIKEFMANKKKQIDFDEDKRKKDKVLQQERLKLNLENLKNEIKEQIGSCKSSSKGGFYPTQSQNQQNSSSKKPKSTNRHVKSLTFSSPQIDNFMHQNSPYSSYVDPNQIQFLQLNNNIGIPPQPDDQVFEYLNEEYKKNFNWRDQSLDPNNLQYQTLQNLQQSSSTYSGQKEDSLYNQNKHMISQSPQKSTSTKKKNDRSQSQKIDYSHQRQLSDQYMNQQFYQNYDNPNLQQELVMQPERLQFTTEDDKTNHNLLLLQQQQYGQSPLMNQYISQKQQLQLLQQLQQQMQQQNSPNNYYYQNNQPEAEVEDEYQQFQNRKNQIYVQYTKLSQRLQKQMFKNIKQQQILQLEQQQKQAQQAQLLNQYSQRNQIQEIQEDNQENVEEFEDENPNQNGYDIPSTYIHEKHSNSTVEKQLNKSFNNGSSDIMEKEIDTPIQIHSESQNKDIDSNRIQNKNDYSSFSSIKKDDDNSHSNVNRMNMRYAQQDESAKLDNSNNVNAYELYKQTELSSIKNNSTNEINPKKNDIYFNTPVQSQQQQQQQQQNKVQGNVQNYHQQNIRQKSQGDQQQQQAMSQESPSKGTNIVDEIPTIQSDASSNFQEQYNNGNKPENNSYGMDEEELEEYMYFNIAAIYIQKVWRGYFTRKLLSEFFNELEEMYQNQEMQEEYQKNISTDQSSNSQKNKGATSNSRQSQDDYHSNQKVNENKNFNNESDNYELNQIKSKQEKMNNRADQFKEDAIQQTDKQQHNLHQNHNVGQKFDAVCSSDENIQPLLIDMNNRNKQLQQKQIKEENLPFKNAAIQQRISSSPNQHEDNSDGTPQSKNNSGGKRQQQPESLYQNQSSKNSHPNKLNLESLITPIDPLQKDQKKKNETLQLQEINEFSKSLVTLKEFEKSSDIKYDQAAIKFTDENNVAESDYQETPKDESSIQSEANAKKKNEQQQVRGIYQENYKKIQEEQVNKWDELIKDLHSLQNQADNKINTDFIQKLCQKYESNKKQLIDDYQNLEQQKEQKSTVSQKSDHKKEENGKSHQHEINQKEEKKDEAKHSQMSFEDSPRQLQKDFKKNNLAVLKRIEKDKELANIRLVLGQEQLTRDQNAIAAALSQSNSSDQIDNQSGLATNSRKNIGMSGLSQSVDFFESRSKQSREKQKFIPNHNEYIFEKIPMRDFASEKYGRLMIKKESMDDLMKMREDIIQCQKEAKLQIISQMYDQKKISRQVYETKKKEIEYWVVKEQDKLLRTHNDIERGWKKFADTVRQTKRGIEFMKQIKKIDYNKLLLSSSDESRFNKILSYRTDSEASESDIFSERRDYHSLSFNLTNQRTLSGISQGASAAGGITPNSIKIVDQYQLLDRPKKFLNPSQGQKYLQNGKQGVIVGGVNPNSKSCTSWDGNILNTNNSEDVEYDDINDYLSKIKNAVAKHLPNNQLYGHQGNLILQQQQLTNNSQQSEEFSTISPNFSRSQTPNIKSSEDNIYNFKKKDDIDNTDQSKNTQIKNFEISPHPKSKLQTQLTNTQQSEPDMKKMGLMSLDSVTSSLQSQNSELQLGQQQFEYENAKKLQQIKIEEMNEDIYNSVPNSQKNNLEKHTVTNYDQNQFNQQNEPKKELMSNEQKANLVSDKIIEDLIEEAKDDLLGRKKGENITQGLNPQNNHDQEYPVKNYLNDALPSNIESRNQIDDKIIPIESCANLNSIKDFLVALAEFIKENFREEFLGRINQALGIDPLEFLKTFNITENTEPQDTETSNAPIYPLVKYIHVQKPVVSEEIFLTFNELYQRMIRRQRKLENQNEDFDEDRFEDDEDDDDIDIFNTQSDIEKYNLKLIFDCFNEALDFMRPYSLGGKPLPWKLNQKKLANMLVKDFDIERVLGMAIGRTLKWGSCLCGFIPEKIEFPPGQDEENNEYLNQIKEDRLAQMLENEVLENEHKWLIYEEEETDVQLEISDDIFHYLMSETAQWLFLKMQGKLELMEQLEITIGREHKQNFDEMVEDEDDQKQLLDYQNSQMSQGSGLKNNSMRNSQNSWNIQKRQKTGSESNISSKEDHYPQYSSEENDNENLAYETDFPHIRQKLKRKSLHQNHFDEDEMGQRDQGEEEEDQEYEQDYFSKNTEKKKEDLKNEKRKMGKQEEIQSKQNEKLVFQRKQQSYSPTNQYSAQHLQQQQHNGQQQDFGEQLLLQQKYAQMIGSSNSKGSSLNSSF